MDRYYVNDGGEIEDSHRPDGCQTLDEVEIVTLLNQLADRDAEIEKLKRRGTRIGEKEMAAENDRLRAEIERLRKLIDDAGAPWIRLDPGVPWEGGIDAAMAAACAEIARLRADLVWAVKHGAFLNHEIEDEPAVFAWFVFGFGGEPEMEKCDGTTESICRAVREARDGS